METMKKNKKAMMLPFVIASTALAMALFIIVSRNSAQAMKSTDTESINAEKADNENTGIGREEKNTPMPLSSTESEEASAERIMTELFPMSDITFGMSLKELADKYPDKGFNMDNVGSQCAISSNKFWTVLTVEIRDGEVKYSTYSGRYRKVYSGPPLLDPHEAGDAVENAKSLFEQLKQLFGPTSERKVIHTGNIQSAIYTYVWRREKDVVVFRHSPISVWEKEKSFYREVSIISPDVSLNQWIPEKGRGEEMPSLRGAEPWLDAEE